MASQQWGRKETVTFPPHSAIYTYGAIFLAFVMTGCFLYVRFTYGQTPLQQFYTPIYARAAAGATLNKKDKYQLLYVGDGTKMGELAGESDVQQGTAPAPGGKHIPLALSSAAAARGLRALYRRARAAVPRQAPARVPENQRLPGRRSLGHLQTSAPVWLPFAARAAPTFHS